MGMDFVLPVRSSSQHYAIAFSDCRALPGSPCSRNGTLAEGLQRNRPWAMFAGEHKFSSSVCSGDGNHMWRVPNSGLYQEGHQYNWLPRSSADLCCNIRFGLRYEDIAGDEHVCCESSFVHNSNLTPSTDRDKRKTHQSRARAVDAGIGLPLSLRMLQRRQQDQGKATINSRLVQVGASLLKAFSSMVHMIKELQTHCLRIQRQCFNQETECLLNQVHREIHTSFLWLFQQVFSCTPELMVLIMVLLADFTAFSMATSVPMGVTMPVSAPALAADVSFSRTGNSFQSSVDRLMMSSPSLVDTASELLDGSSWTGSGSKWSNRSYSAAASGDGESDTSKPFSSVSKVPYSEEDGLLHDISSVSSVQFAGVSSLTEDDSYTCYDRTELAYQYAINSNAANSMLLSNYAQFLFLVRKDNDRAEELFRQAVLCDPLDGETGSRFARFLWLARRNLPAAGRAYQAAVCADPSNSFHAADYAHFLWNSGQ